LRSYNLDSDYSELPELYQEIIRKHHSYLPTKQGYQNKIVRNNYKSSSSIINMEHSVQPMSFESIREKYNNVSEEVEIEAAKNYEHYLNPTSIFRTMELNAVGKDQVGIYANGIKVTGLLQEYYNEYYRNKAVLQEANNVEVSDPIKEFSLGIKDPKTGVYSEWQFSYFDEKGELKTIKVPVITSFGNCRKVEEFAKALSVPDDIYAKYASYIEQTENIADMLSMMISLSTDNAKELLLGLINSTPDTANLFIAMLSAGLEMQDIITIASTTLK
jgi:hypothetical protein